MPHPQLPMFEALGHYMDLLMDAICVVNAESEFVYISAGGERIFGYKPQEMVGHSIFEFVHPDDQAKTRTIVAEIMEGDAKTDFENRYLRKDGSIAYIVWSARFSADDNIRIAVARDVSAQRAIEQERERLVEQLQHRAHHDLLTGLPNRGHFYRHAELLLQDDAPVAIAYIDLNNFKEVNDQYGHAMGDDILRAAALRLQRQTRSADTIARIGGDEFVALFANVGSEVSAEAIVEKLQESLANPIQVGELSFVITASIGCVISRAPHPQLENLLQHADTLMYRAKQNDKPSSLIRLL
ncbi:diguanylate cyclase domain-containing protein [Pseudidiomarina aquimaris]|uniref:diguanylate cyclase domain-containing protein n=1 Tax=Pseudidiomarina aquimaris TaxID=641841 RepID=UPI003A984A55